MNARSAASRWLVGAGCLVLVAGALLHLIAAYPKVSPAVLASNLNPSLQSALRSVFLIIGCHWIFLAAIAMVGAFSRTSARRTIVLLCALALFVDAALMASFLGWFMGTAMILASALLILCGGLAVTPAQPAGGAIAR